MDLVQLGLVQWSSKYVCGYAGFSMPDDLIVSKSTASHTHTHPFNGPFSGTTWVSRYQKGKTNLDFIEARDSEWQWHQLGHIINNKQICIAP